MECKLITSTRDGSCGYYNEDSDRVFNLADAESGALDFCSLSAFNAEGIHARRYFLDPRVAKIEDLVIG